MALNTFWDFLDLEAKDVVFLDAPQYFNGYGDVTEFVAYGIDRCWKMGLDDDKGMARFLVQALEGEVKAWFDMLPCSVQSSWMQLRFALLEDYCQGGFLEALHFLREHWWQVQIMKHPFNIVWKAYEHVSFFRADLLQVLKSKRLAKYREAKAKLEALQEAHESRVIDMIDFTIVQVPLEATKEGKVKNCREVSTHGYCDAMDANDDGYYSSSVEESSDDESIHA